MNKPETLYNQDYYSISEFQKILSAVKSSGLQNARSGSADFYNQIFSAWESGWKEAAFINGHTRYVWQMYYFIDRDFFNVYGLLFCTSIEEMPLYVNDIGYSAEIAKLRLEFSK